MSCIGASKWKVMTIDEKGLESQSEYLRISTSSNIKAFELGRRTGKE